MCSLLCPLYVRTPKLEVGVSPASSSHDGSIHVGKREKQDFTKCDIHCLILFGVVTTLPYSTLIFNFLIISVRRYARRCTLL